MCFHGIWKSHYKLLDMIELQRWIRSLWHVVDLSWNGQYLKYWTVVFQDCYQIFWCKVITVHVVKCKFHLARRKLLVAFWKLNVSIILIIISIFSANVKRTKVHLSQRRTMIQKGSRYHLVNALIDRERIQTRQLAQQLCHHWVADRGVHVKQDSTT